MDGFVILARFRIAPGSLSEFLDQIVGNAAASLAREPGCRRFDVLTDAKAPPGDGTEDEVAEVVLYEIYDSPPAFAAHLATPHFAAFQSATEAIVLSSAVERFYLRKIAAEG